MGFLPGLVSTLLIEAGVDLDLPAIDINDPEHTAALFGNNPHRPGQRLYRSRDFGWWLPDGKVEFQGRRDTKVKIREFHIEIGKIENQLLRVAGARDGAVVTKNASSKNLVGF
ncbi:hypothetical protein [Saccharopolyspora gloriosae]|uniref:hypothetical protein n=1 Tax=Saccharopolyspora gloriosae TaxID=455344 RepID=UPI001FB794B2|nr:hypothetical protein [Saccharopolyspora gloriosae]